VKTIAAIGLFLTGAWMSGLAQVLPGGETILRRVDDSIRAVGDYTVDLDIAADLEGISVPPSRVRMSFKYPDRTRFEAEGFALVPREALDLTPGRILDRFSVEDVMGDTLGVDPAYRLLLRPVPGRTRFRMAEIVVHARRWTIDRLTASLPGGQTLDARFVPLVVEGHWLPGRLTLRFSAPHGRETPLPPSGIEKPDAGLQTFSPRGGTVSILYSGYRVHAGLPDSLFSPAPRP
jgi:hypothetical protein